MSIKSLLLKPKKAGPQKPPRSPPDRRADLTEQFDAATTGRGVSSKLPGGGKLTDRTGGRRGWPKPGSLEQRESDSDDALRRYR